MKVYYIDFSVLDIHSGCQPLELLVFDLQVNESVIRGGNGVMGNPAGLIDGHHHWEGSRYSSACRHQRPFGLCKA